MESLDREEMYFLTTESSLPKYNTFVLVACSTRNFCHKYQEFDPMLTPPIPSNPWTTGDTTLWTLESSL